MKISYVSVFINYIILLKIPQWKALIDNGKSKRSVTLTTSMTSVAQTAESTPAVVNRPQHIRQLPGPSASLANVEVAQTVVPLRQSQPEPLHDTSAATSPLKSHIITKIYEGFRTATGKSLAVTEQLIREQAQTLFADILNDSTTTTGSKGDPPQRENKYSFLRKVTTPTVVEERPSDQDEVVVGSPVNSTQYFEGEVFSQLRRCSETTTPTPADMRSEQELLDRSKHANFLGGISDSQLVQAAEDAVLVKARDGSPVSPKLKKFSRKNKENANSHATNITIVTNTTTEMQHKEKRHKNRIKTSTSKNVVELIVPQRDLDAYYPAPSNNLYELHRNDGFTTMESESGPDSRKSDYSMFAKYLTVLHGKHISHDFKADQAMISRETYESHAKKLDEVIHSMKMEERIKKQQRMRKHKRLEAVASKRKLYDLVANATESKIRTTSVMSSRCTAVGFATAAGRPIPVSQSALTQAQKLYESVPPVLEEEGDNRVDAVGDASITGATPKCLEIQIGTNHMQISINSKFANAPQIGFRSASGRDIQINSKALEAANKLYRGIDDDVQAEFATKPHLEDERLHKAGFRSAAGCVIPVAAGGLETAQKLNAGLESDTVTSQSVSKNVSEKIASDTNEMRSVENDVAVKETIDEFRLSRDDANDLMQFKQSVKPLVLGFASASGHKINVSEQAMLKAQALYEESEADNKLVKYDILDEPSRSSEDKQKVGVMFSFATAAGKAIEVSDDSLVRSQNMLAEMDLPATIGEVPQSTTSLKSVQELIGDAVSSVNDALHKLNNRQVHQRPSARRHLGMAGPKTKPITVSRENVHAAKALFAEDLKLDLSFCNVPIVDAPRQRSPKSENKSRIPVLESSTPARRVKPRSSESPMQSPDLTPIKPLFKSTVVNRNLSTIMESSSSIVLMEQSSSDLSTIKEDLEREGEVLRKKLAVIQRRKSALDMQETIMRTCSEEYKKPKAGILYMVKQQCSNRVPLSRLHLCDAENLDFFKIDNTILDFNFGMADQVHFKSTDKPGEGDAVTNSKDGAVVVPNAKDVIGMNEIVHGFRTMPGVDPALAPSTWVENHFRMIVWKLASYERVFPHYFKDVLTAENVMQQLKYRYDREIDRAERPALRRIMEKDDVAQKRIVLAVTKILTPNDIELTDGWYSVRTSIDQPLSNQLSDKIRPGTKLMIQNAELLNCDGCHPLEASEDVRLRINYNATRRAVWHAKLGYQRNPSPLPISLSTINPQGGKVAYVKVVVCRSYPIRYLEEQDGRKVWRNYKAEERRANDFDRAMLSQIEEIHSRAANDSTRNNNKSSTNRKITAAELSKLDCPQTLCELLDSSKDPDGFVELLSADQRNRIMDFKLNRSAQKQHDMCSKVAKELEEVSSRKRSVTSMLRLIVSDASSVSVQSSMVLNVWRPTEENVQCLTEGALVSAYNVMPSKLRDELSTTAKSYFKLEELKCKRNSRQIVPIAMTHDLYYKPMYNEFDTIGVVVRMVIDSNFQELWLTDLQNRLLYVRIRHGPDMCCLLDQIRRGDTICLMNLNLKTPHANYGQCLADHSTIATQFPQLELHQNSLEIFRQQLPNDLGQLLSDCDMRIEKYRLVTADSRKRSLIEVSYDEGANSLPAGLTSLDMAMSLIDMDQFDS